MHYFLTGNIQVGKSTVIKRYLEKTGIHFSGVKTKWHKVDGGMILALTRYTPDFTPYEEHEIAATRMGKIQGPANPPKVNGHVFDTLGPEYLIPEDGTELIIMDELGFMESRSEQFQKAVLHTLDGNIPVFGVIQPRDLPFLNSIRERSDVTVVTVTPENREQVYLDFLSTYKF